MANNVYNTIGVKGDTTTIIDFLNDGLKSAGLATISSMEDIKTNAETMEKLSMRSWLPMPETFTKMDTSNLLTKREWFPKNDAEIEYVKARTTNPLPLQKEELDKIYNQYVEDYNAECQKQQDEYGVVGWYSYNLATLGCKWNKVLYNVEVKNDNLIYIDVTTPWSAPEKWLDTIAEKYPDLTFLMYAVEEFNNILNVYDPQEKDVILDYSELIEQVYASKASDDTKEEIVSNLREDCFEFFEKSICEC